MKTMLITGGAAGIGLATARHFAKHGYFLGLYDIDEQALNALKSDKDFANACFGRCDVRDLDSIKAMFSDFTAQTDGKLNVLINNAGVLSSGEFADIAPEFHDAIIDINVRGFTHVAQQGFTLLRNTPNSCLVNLCSLSSVHGVPGLAVYSASKFYVNGLTQALSLEWRKHDIRVTCVKPPFVNTAMVDAVNDSLKQVLKVDTNPEDVARTIERAITGKSDGYIMGSKSKIWALLDRLSPEPISRVMARAITKT